jgi:predicted site-specific integrase-resolvase
LARDELLTVPEVIGELQISRATFYRWLATGKGPKTLKAPRRHHPRAPLRSRSLPDRLLRLRVTE